MRLSTFDGWRLDVRLGVRMLVNHPGIALASVSGIAVAVAIAAGSYSVILRNFLASSLPLDEGDRVVAIELWDSATGTAEHRVLHDFQTWRDGLKSIVEISAFRNLTPNIVTLGATPESVRVAAMSASGFRVARVRPLLGRALEESDERTGAPAVAVIGESVWRTRFASDPAILGRIISFGATPHTVVGVMPAGFAFPVNYPFWTPLRPGQASEPRSGPALRVFGRLAPGATVVAAQAELTAAARRTAQQFPALAATLQPRVSPYATATLGMSGEGDMAGLVAAQGLILSLLVLVCLNVAILVYTRTAMRQQELGLRTALGASRRRIVGQLFVEALVLSGVAAVLGTGIAALALRYMTDVITPLAPELPYWVSMRLEPTAVVYAAVLAILAAAIVGIVPGLPATGRRLQTGMRIASTGGSGMRLGKTWTALIVAQTGFTVAILPPGVFHALESLSNGLAGVGFAADQYLSAKLEVEPELQHRFATMQSEWTRRVEADPRVAGITFALALPGDEPGARIETDGREAVVRDARFNLVDPGFFRAFEVRLLAGRGLESGDVAPGRPGGPPGEPPGAAAVINQSLAQQAFSGDALGRRLRYVERRGGEMKPGRWYEVAGIVSDFPVGVSPGMRDGAAKVYHAIAPGQAHPAAFAVRMRGDAAAFGPRLREVAAEVDPELHLREVRVLDEVLRREQWIVRLEAAVTLAVTVSVLALASTGVYALMAFTVSQRRKEIGIRMAIGSSAWRVVTSVFARALLQLGAGAVVGVVLGMAVARAAGGGSMQGSGPAVTAGVAAVMMAAGFLAALGPVRRSLRVEPVDALRE